ncbi:MAG: PEP-CTERM sorting domain-containing protein [Phycisphaerae bacterium]|nr:PEP-CTERM sorting domain-containing protein [Phycisphaerae bacterium]
MKSKFITTVIFFVVLCFTVSTKASIYINSQLYSGNTLSITDSSYNNLLISISGDSIVNIFYEDEYVGQDPTGFYQPGITFNIDAQDNAVVNFFIPENDEFSFYLWDTEDNLPSNFLDVYAGLQISALSYPSASYTELWRSYGDGVPQVLSPQIGSIQLQDSSAMNFVPEPATFLLFGIGGFLISKKSK